MACFWSSPPGLKCWVSFRSGIQSYILLSHYLCFISCLYLYLCVLIRIRIKGEVGAVKHVQAFQ